MPSPRSLPLALTLLTVLLSPASSSTIPSLFSMPYHTIFTRQVSNLQTFTGSLGGAAPPITQSGDSSRPFEVGGSTFTDFKSAAQRTCDNQFTACASQANAEQNKGGFTVADCSDQKTQCEAAQASAGTQSFVEVPSVNIGPDPDFPDFDLICDA
ncbi:hypothetical protein V2W45_604791 [Cenococcum geophilum]